MWGMMSDYRELGAAQRAVADPSTSPEALAQIAEHQPSLRRAVAAHPNAYAGLLAWLEQAGDAKVEATPEHRDPLPKETSVAVEPQQPAEAAPASGKERRTPKPPKESKAPKAAKGPKVSFWRRHRALLGTGIALVVLGLVGSAFAGGWIASARWGAERVSPQVTPSVVMIPDVPEGVRMPDLRGLSKDEALQVIADAGWDVAKVALTAEPFAGPPDIVVAQTPAFGATDVPAISLTLSQQAVVPQIAGRKASELITELRNVGVNVQLEYGYDPQVDPGGVLSISPAAGEPLTTDATVTIAESGTAVFLSQLTCPNGCLSNHSSLVLDGNGYANGLYTDLRFDSSDTETVVEHHEYQLGRRADVFIATVGIPDDVSDTSGTIRVRLVGDGRELASVTTSYSKPAELTAVVTGVLRLDIQTSFAQPPDGDYGRQTLALGDARVVGSDAEMTALAGE